MDDCFKIGYNTEKGGDKMNYLNQEAPLTNFKMLFNSPIYVDKSGMIDILNKNIATINRYICITKPRRFGKTLNANRRCPPMACWGLIIRKDIIVKTYLIN